MAPLLLPSPLGEGRDGGATLSRLLLLALFAANAHADDACPPGAKLEDEPVEIRALGAESYVKHVLPGCPLDGCAGDSKAQAELNRRKGRADTPREDEIDARVTLARVLASERDDRRRFKEGTAVRVVGFVRQVWPGGIESANCRTERLEYRDTHIGLFASELESDKREKMILEVTPRSRAVAAARGEDWSTQALQQTLIGHWVEATGWTFFDVDHCNETANTEGADGDCGGPGQGVWRRTGWEVHPVTALKVLPAKP